MSSNASALTRASEMNLARAHRPDKIRPEERRYKHETRNGLGLSWKFCGRWHVVGLQAIPAHPVTLSNRRGRHWDGDLSATLGGRA
jgi:hypothetical protein